MKSKTKSSKTAANPNRTGFAVRTNIKAGRIATNHNQAAPPFAQVEPANG